MIRIAAVGDVHYGMNCRDKLRHHFLKAHERADLLLIAGDLTQSGSLPEAEALAHDLSDLPIPVIVVLGNHDFHQNQETEISALLKNRGIIVLEGNSCSFVVRGNTVGIAGIKGFGGGFPGASITEFGEPEMKAFARHCRLQSETLKETLEDMDAEYRFALLHFSPVEGTLLGERKEIYPFLGSYLLAEAIDAAEINGVFHGHAHHGVEKSSTPGGIPVRNVAQMVIREAYRVYSFS